MQQKIWKSVDELLERVLAKWPRGALGEKYREELEENRWRGSYFNQTTPSPRTDTHTQSALCACALTLICFCFYYSSFRFSPPFSPHSLLACFFYILTPHSLSLLLILLVLFLIIVGCGKVAFKLKPKRRIPIESY